MPKNVDGFVNWLTTHLINAVGHTATTRWAALEGVNALLEGGVSIAIGGT